MSQNREAVRFELEWPSIEAMPPGARVYRDPSDGRLKRNVIRPLGAGQLEGKSVVVCEIVPRLVALTLDEARREGLDFYHPTRGWIRDGRKAEREAWDPVPPEGVIPTPDPASIEVNEYRRRGGEWPPPPTARDRLYDLVEDRDRLHRELRLQDASRMLRQALGGDTPDDTKEDQALRGELQRIERAIEALAKSGKGPALSRRDADRQDLLKAAERVLERVRAGDELRLDSESLRTELGGLSRSSLSRKLNQAGLTMKDLKNGRIRGSRRH